MKRLTIGKLRGIQQLADRSGVFAMCAMDHRGSMAQMINRADPQAVTYEQMVEHKIDLAEFLAPVSTAILLDPVFGAAQAAASGVLPGDVGLLVSLEETGYEQDTDNDEQGGRVTTLLPGWSASKIKRMGATGAKILLYYRSDLRRNSAKQRRVVRRVAEACDRADLPFLLEPVSYALPTEKDAAAFAAKKPMLAAGAANDLSPLGVDVLKTEFPADMRYEKDEGKLRESCEVLDVRSQAPWVLLSGGVAFEDFSKQVEIACRAGASGCLGGRAVWDEALKMRDARERRHWLETVGADRMRRLHDIVGTHGRPWWKKWGETVQELTEVRPDWYQVY